MTNDQILTKLENRISHFYGTMYGFDKSNDKVIKITTWHYEKDWYGKGPALIYLWGWPGPDGNVYLFSDYGRTWAFTKKEMENK